MDFCEICFSQGNTLLTYNALLLFHSYLEFNVLY